MSPSVNLETAQQERSMLLSGDNRLLREGNDVDLLCNQKGNYESLKLILIRLKCMYLARTSKEMHMNPDVFGLTNTKRLCRNAVLHQGDAVVMMWRTCHLIA
jgi:hypothetical protein